MSAPSSHVRRKTVMVVYGTRPEAIKMAPVVRELRSSPHLDVFVAVTGQHRAMLDQVNSLFGIVPDADLDVIQPRQTLADITQRVVMGITDLLQRHRPDAVLVQGDTTTTFAAALAAFYEKVPVVHLEAGLRTQNRYDPFPEELNRRMTSQLASLHLAPTATSRANLIHDGIAAADIVVTGNTVIDALLDVVHRHLPLENKALREMALGDSVLVTTHRRESWGEPMSRTASAVARLAKEFEDIRFVVPAHLNPVVREVLLPPLQGLKNVLITEPLCYSDFARAMFSSKLILTDSGGVQEEAPSLGKPVLVLRDTTERPEAVEAGTVKLVGTDEQRIVEETRQLLTDASAYDEMAHATNPYGDGHAAVRACHALEWMFGLSDRPSDWVVHRLIASSQVASSQVA